MKSLVQNSGDNSGAPGNTAKIVLKGETFLIKGLPAALQGKEVAFIAKKTATATGSRVELRWLNAAAVDAGKGHKTAAHQAEKNLLTGAINIQLLVSQIKLHLLKKMNCF